MLKRPRAAVFVSGGGTNLQALIDKRGSVITSGDIALVVSNKADAYAIERARAAGIDTAYIPFDKQNPYTFENEVSWLLKDKQIDVIVLAGFLCILSENFTERYDHRMINVHPSLIPSFCGKGFYGLKVHEAALEYGVKVTGATVHYVNAVADGGEIILQKAVEILEGDTPETLQRRVMEQAEWELLPKALELVFKRIVSEQNGDDEPDNEDIVDELDALTADSDR